ncbi:unnamed protein product, partial [Mycena citricolor]
PTSLTLMNFCRRPDSPPPRSPSPDVVLSPLPAPRRHPPRPSRLSLQNNSTTRQQLPVESKRSLTAMRSCGELRNVSGVRSAPVSRPVRSAPSTPRTTAPPSPSDPNFRRPAKRTLSYAVPYRSPPASPTLSFSPPPPVPPVPDFVLSPGDKKPVIHAAPPTTARTSRVYLPAWEQFGVIPDLVAGSAPARKRRVSTSPRRADPAAKASPASTAATALPSAPMTCATYFALHNSSEQRTTPVITL